MNHIRGIGEPLNGTWQHLTFVQQEDGSRAFYINGALDGLAIPAKEAGDWRVTATSIGGILRANPSHWLTGAIDEVALWSRALTPAEIQQVNTEDWSASSRRSPAAWWPLATR